MTGVDSPWPFELLRSTAGDSRQALSGRRPLACRMVVSISLLSGTHSICSASMAVSAIFVNLFLSRSHTHNFACPLPSLSDRKAKYRPLGDHLASQLSSAGSPIILSSPLATLVSTIFELSACQGTPEHSANPASPNVEDFARKLFLRAYATHSPSGEKSGGEPSPIIRTSSRSFAGTGFCCALHGHGWKTIRYREARRILPEISILRLALRGSFLGSPTSPALSEVFHPAPHNSITTQLLWLSPPLRMTNAVTTGATADRLPGKGDSIRQALRSAWIWIAGRS